MHVSLLGDLQALLEVESLELEFALELEVP